MGLENGKVFSVRCADGAELLHLTTTTHYLACYRAAGKVSSARAALGGGGLTKTCSINLEVHSRAAVAVTNFGLHFNIFRTCGCNLVKIQTEVIGNRDLTVVNKSLQYSVRVAWNRLVEPLEQFPQAWCSLAGDYIALPLTLLKHVWLYPEGVSNHDCHHYDHQTRLLQKLLAVWLQNQARHVDSVKKKDVQCWLECCLGAGPSTVQCCSCQHSRYVFTVVIIFLVFLQFWSVNARRFYVPWFWTCLERF